MASSKPQLSFKCPPDNSNSPFVPPHRHNVTPHAPGVPHPVENELITALLREKYMPLSTIATFTELSNVDPSAWIDTPDALEAMVMQLVDVRAIAVDLEHHNERSFLGFTCLLQLSTHQSTWVVDAIKLRKHIHQALVGVFENPNIVKVFHDARGDITWLEKDFGLYVVNLFDTYVAAKALGDRCPRQSLNGLLEVYCDFRTSKNHKKHMQRTDWRTRPLSDKKLKYARADTHFLLHVYDRLRHMLRDSELLTKVLEDSVAVSRVRFVKPVNKLRELEGSGLSEGFDIRQIYMLRALSVWRFDEAREQDEGIGYILTKRHMLKLACHNPKDEYGVHLALDVDFDKKLPEYIAGNLDRVLDVLEKASCEDMDPEWVKSIEKRQAARSKSISMQTSTKAAENTTHPHPFANPAEAGVESSETVQVETLETSDEIMAGHLPLGMSFAATESLTKEVDLKIDDILQASSIEMKTYCDGDERKTRAHASTTKQESKEKAN